MPRQLKKQLSIDTELLNWIGEYYPDYSLQWTVNTLLRSLMEVSFERNPRDLSKLAAKMTMDEIEEDS